MNRPEFILNNVSKIYSVNNKSHIVFENLNISIKADEITVIIGESGCGKTTLLRIIAGLEDFNSGKVSYFQDKEIKNIKTGIVFQESRLMPWLNVTENILFSINNKNIRKNTEVLKKLDKYLKIMKLENFKKAYPNELSGGMAQRVSIARAMFYEPDVFLMDEPFSALDYFTKKDMQSEVIKIYEETKKGIIFVTHDIDEALKIANKIIVFTPNKTIEEFEINYGFDRNITDEKFIKLKDKILKILKEE
ncbi:ATP-binding cassette domain-containing protein [Clostridium sp. BJN0001]|uniref:ABC transporter ATP-binding protein n=1 Tax=Clostridium sp. BJN0001 TaxID=2930219 RepID=UPI001FD5251C|nr:ATP-binding cassette domain-containing protein [Clostridium sp. BJN0001]